MLELCYSPCFNLLLKRNFTQKSSPRCISKIRFLLETLKFEDIGSKFSKNDARFLWNIFEIKYIQNLVNIRKLILIGPKTICFGVLELQFSKTNVKFEISTLKIGICEISLRLKVNTFWPNMPKLEHLDSKYYKNECKIRN